MAITVPTPADQGAQSLGGVEGQAAQTPYQNLQLPDLAFNARTLGQLGGMVGDFAKEMQRRHEETALLEMQQAYSEFERDLMYNLETGVMKTEKVGAAGITDRVRAESTAFFAQYTQDNKTYTRSATMALKSFAQQRQIGLLDAAARHEMSENERYRGELKAAASANAIATAGLSFASNTALIDQEAIIRSSTASQFEADRRVAPEVVAELTASRVDEMYRAAISGALMLDTTAGRARAAELYTAAVDAGKLNLSENDPITRAVVFGTEEDGRSAAVSMLVAQAGGDLAKAVELAADVSNANAYDRGKIIEEIETMMRSKDRAAAAVQKDLETRAASLAAESRLMEMTGAERAQISEATYNRLLRLNNREVEFSDSTSSNFLNSLSDLQWGSVDMSVYADKLTPEDFTMFSKEQADIAARIKNAMDTQNVGMSSSQLIEEFANRAGLNGADKAADRSTFNLGMNYFVQAYKLDNNGQAPTQDQLAAEADRLQLRVVTAAAAVQKDLETRAASLAAESRLMEMTGAERAQISEATYNRLLRLNNREVEFSDSTSSNFLNSLSDLQWGSVDMSVYAGKLTPEDFTMFSKEQADIAARLKNAVDTQNVGMSSSQLIEGFANRAGLNGADKAADRSIFNLGMNYFVQAYKLDNNGQEPTQDQLAAEADRLQLRVVTDQGMIWDTRQSVAEVLQAPPALVDDAGQAVDTATVRAFIRAVVEMQREDAILTSEDLQALYLAYLAEPVDTVTDRR